MILSPEQAIARLQPSGKQKAKGQQTIALTDVFGRAEDYLYVFSNDYGGIITSGKPSPHIVPQK